MKTYPKQKIGSRAYIGESMVKILICDDDQTFAQSMFKRILSLPAYSSKSMKLSCLTDIAEMSANTIAQYDILFLDIDLGKESGIDLARKMRKMNPEAVLIFVTNFSEYALRAMKWMLFDTLPNPSWKRSCQPILKMHWQCAAPGSEK